MSEVSFQLGFLRMFAVLGVGVGLALVGVALGLVYLDVRGERAIELAIQAKIAEPEAIDAWSDPMPIFVALASGSLGAALVGSAGLLALYDLVWNWKRR